MRLLDTTSLKFREFLGGIQPYAILSHTWQEEEVLFHEMDAVTEGTKSKVGFKKIASFCALAKSLGFQYAWVDSCCIDKRSSSELSESLNSMYRWYSNASLCIIYLADVPALGGPGTESKDAQIHAIRTSRWFTRGWTLQELLATKCRQFHASDWSEISISPFGSLPLELISEITGIDLDLLHNCSLISNVCVAKRMSWASKRETTKQEDAAYSLMGLFNVSMPILYGEGLRKAFRRLQDEIMKTSFDQSLFAWRGNYESSGLLADSPADFKDTPELGLWGRDMLYPFSMTNVGLLIRPCFFVGKESSASTARSSSTHRVSTSQISSRMLSDVPYVQAALQCDVKTRTGWKVLLLHLQPIEDGECWMNGRSLRAYRRIHCNTFEAMPGSWLVGKDSLYDDVVVLEDEHYAYLSVSENAHNARQEENNFADDGLETLQIEDDSSTP